MSFASEHEPPAWFDTLTMSIPVLASYGDRTPDTPSKLELPGGGTAMLKPSQAVWAEASLPKRAFGQNVDLVNLPDALEIAREMYREVASVWDVDPDRHGDRFDEIDVVRLDTARDFDDVHDFGALVDGLERVPRQRQMTVRRIQSRGARGAPSLIVGTKDWNGQIYDKSAESRGEAPEGRVRFEARVRRDTLRDADWLVREAGQLRTIRDIEEERVQRIRRTVFERVGFDRAVVSPEQIEDAIFVRSNLSTGAKAGLWAFMTAPTYRNVIGVEARRRYLKHAGALGAVPGRLVLSGDRSVCRRLDYLDGVVAATLELENPWL